MPGRSWNFPITLKGHSARRRFFAAALAAPLLFLGARYCVGHYVDFPVYWNAARSLLAGRRDLYEPTFVFGKADRMNYRYPPLFLLLFAPMGLLPYPIAGYLWFAGKLAALAFVLRWIDRLARDNATSKVRFWAIPFFTATPYLVQDLHYGNVHLFVIALTVAALYASETGREGLSSAALALAVTIKVFPGFLLPYFAIQRRFRYVVLTLFFLVLLNLSGGVYLGFGENLSLLVTWAGNLTGNRYFAELNTGMDYSLRGVLDRYLTHVPYELRPIDNSYPNINVAVWSSSAVAALRLGITAAFLLFIGFLCWRYAAMRAGVEQPREQRLLAYGVIACAMVLFPPAVNYQYFELLALPAAIISGYLARWPAHPRTRTIASLAVAACALSAVPPLLPGRALQREVQMYSPFFFSALALFVSCALALTASNRNDEEKDRGGR